jgi:lipopolysaccharide/colanic/teichoic acid biosynthesis glycosyltransferase
MIFGRIWRTLSATVRLVGGRGSRGICSADEFREIIDRERTRCDRNSHEFSLMLINLESIDDEKAFLRDLKDVLAARIRCTDDFGWLDAEQIGVVLPDTPNWGGKKFADDVRDRLSFRGRRLTDYAVYTYPVHCMPDGNGRGSNGDDGCRQMTFGDVGNRDEEPSRERRTGGNGNSSACERESGKPAPNQSRSWPVDNLSILSRNSIPSWKRTMDCVGAAVMIVVWAPFFAVAACWVKLVSPGPVFFKQKRVGLSGLPFRCWKLRTMRQGAETAAHVAHVKSLICRGNGSDNRKPMAKLDENDDRIVPLGKLFRLIGLDELPQLVNVLRGEMSLVGPRPCLPYEFEEYNLWHTRRCDAVPGLTGLWQVSGKNRTSFLEMMRLDINYSRHLSFWQDVKILVLTLPAIIGQIRQ